MGNGERVMAPFSHSPISHSPFPPFHSPLPLPKILLKETCCEEEELVFLLLLIASVVRRAIVQSGFSRATMPN